MFAGYRLDELTEALARYEEAFELYERALADAFATWEHGNRMDAARLGLAAAISLSRCLGTRLHTRPLTGLLIGLEQIQFDRKTPVWLKPETFTSAVPRQGATPFGDRITEATAIGVLIELRARGQKPKDAADKIANALNNANYLIRGYQEPGADTIRNWCRLRKKNYADLEHIWRLTTIHEIERQRGTPLTEAELLTAMSESVGLL